MALTFYNAWRTVSSTSSDSYKEDFQAFVDAEFEDSPTIKTVKHNGVNVVVRVVGKFNIETVRRNNDNYQKIIFKTADYSVVIGDLFEFYGSKWLCTDINFTSVSKSCSVTKCNNTLKYYDENHIWYNIPCIVIDKQNINQEENKYIFTIDCDVVVMVSKNEITNLISPDDIFKIGRWNYSVVKPDDITKPGLIILPMKFSEAEQENHVYQLTILNGDSLQIAQSQQLTINAELTDNNMIIPSPTLLYSSSNENVAIIDGSGVVSILSVGIVTFTVSMASDNTVSDSINVTIVADEQHNYSVEISGVTSITKGYTSSYNCVFKDNGNIIVDTSQFYLTGDDGVSVTNLAEIVSQDSVANTCQIKGNAIGYVKLFVRNLNGNIVSDGLRIQIKNIF